MSADRLRTVVAACLLVITASCLTLVVTSVSQGRDEPRAAQKRSSTPSTKPRPYGLLLLGSDRRFPASAIPRVGRARNADRLQGRTAAELTDTCGARTVDLGDWCLDTNPMPVPPEDAGKNDFFYATKACATEGGYLPSAAELLGAVDRVKLASTIDDSQLTASIDLDPTDGLRDRREMSSTLVVVRGGSASAGSIGVTEGSRGNSQAGEPDPVPLPADPRPETLQYVTVYDNKDKGGFAGSKPVGQPENFRCAFAKTSRVKPAE
jgi:hypothetical protein